MSASRALAPKHSHRVPPRFLLCGRARPETTLKAVSNARCKTICQFEIAGIGSVTSASDCRDTGDSVIIVGAGLAGLCLAAALRKVGISYYVLEQRDELSKEGAAIALWGNAFKALEQIGVADTIRQEHSPILNVSICRDTGKDLKTMKFGGPSVDGFELIGVPRARLQQLLFEAADADRVLLDATITGVDTAETAVLLADGRKLKGRVVVGADGVRSAVASGLGVPPPNLTGQMAFRGVAEFDGPLSIASSTVCQVWGKGSRAGLYPMNERSVYWFATQDWEGELPERTPAEVKEEVRDLVQGWQGGIRECIDSTDADCISRSRLGDRWVPPQLGAAPNFTLAGDALHPMTPNLGQGGCTALEDGIVMAQQLKAAWESSDDAAVPLALRSYEQARAKRCVPLTVRSNLIGRIAQGGNPAVAAARDAMVPLIVKPDMFFEHTLFDCGKL